MSAPFSASSASAIVEVVIVSSFRSRWMGRTSTLSGLTMATLCGSPSSKTYTTSWDITESTAAWQPERSVTDTHRMCVAIALQPSRLRGPFGPSVRCRQYCRRCPSLRSHRGAPDLRDRSIWTQLACRIRPVTQSTNTRTRGESCRWWGYRTNTGIDSGLYTDNTSRNVPSVSWRSTW